jgi:enamine deaminase RidA (YjgF/YER057c/UK114 family)
LLAIYGNCAIFINDNKKVLDHFGYSFDDVIDENVFTTQMAKFLVEIELEAYKAH